MTQEYLKSIVEYDKDSGKFYRIKSRHGKPIRKILDSKPNQKTGYIEFRLFYNGSSKKYRSHRLAFLYVTGEIPEFVDHINHNRSDNRWDNLRSVTRSENAKNKSKYKSNNSGVTGVYWMKHNKRWWSMIVSDGKRISLGYYKNKEDAIEARVNAEICYGFHSNHGIDKQQEQ